MVLSQRQKREKNRRKEEMVEAAELLFFSRGFEETSMDQIAEAAEFSKRTLYKYFPSKEELISAIALRGLLILKDLMIKKISKEKNSIDQAYALAGAFIEFYNDYHNYHKAKIYFLRNIEKQNGTGENTRKCRRLISDLQEILVEIINQGIKDGSFRSDLDRIKTAATVAATINGVVMLSSEARVLNKEFHVSYEEILNQGIEMMVEYIRKRN